MPSRDQKVESALILAWSTIPAASSVPFLTIPALVEWTPSDITEGDLVEYARRHERGTSTEDAVRRGVVVQVVHHKGTMAKHHVFVLFSPYSAVPQCDAPFRSRFYALKRHVADLWYVDQHELSSKLLHRPHIEHKNTATYGPSLAFEFLGVAEPASSERPDREARAAVLCALGMVMSFGHESLLMIFRSQPRLSLSSSSSSSSSSSLAASGATSSSSSSTTTTTGNSDAAMEVDGVATSAAGGDASAAVEAFYKSFHDLGQEQRRQALILLNKKMDKAERFMLQGVFEVSAPDEMLPDAVAKVVKEEMRSLSIVMKDRAEGLKRPDVSGAAAFVTEGATLAAFSHAGDSTSSGASPRRSSPS